MTPKKFKQRMVIILVALLCFNQFLLAQTETKLSLAQQDSIQLKKFGLFDDLSVFPVPDTRNTWIFSPETPGFKNLQYGFEFNQKRPPKSFSVSQSKFETTMPGLGSIEHFTNQFRWNAGDKLVVDFGAGLAIQNTVLNPLYPNYQLSFRASIEYSFNDWLSAYLYGQYITKPLNKPNDYFDPLLYNNPLFLQNEIGAGMKANFNKTHIGFEIYSMPGQEFKSVRLRPTNSRITIGF